MRTLLCISTIILTLAIAAEETVIEKETAPEKVTSKGGLGTRGYLASKKEEPFLEKVPAEERINGHITDGDEETYTIKGKKNANIAWFGIVRQITKVKDKDEYELLLEHKYFDGLTDLHILALSFNGNGDFKATIHAKELDIPLLSLVRCYGKVSDEKDGVPAVDLAYVRVYPWKTFTFIDAYGKDKSNPEWRKNCKVKLDEIYNPFPTTSYFEERLGKVPAVEKK